MSFNSPPKPLPRPVVRLPHHGPEAQVVVGYADSTPDPPQFVESALEALDAEEESDRLAALERKVGAIAGSLREVILEVYGMQGAVKGGLERMAESLERLVDRLEGPEAEGPEEEPWLRDLLARGGKITITVPEPEADSEARDV